MTTNTRRPVAGTAPVRTAALLIGAAFLVVGILGFIPGVTTDYDAMTFAGHDSGAELFGVFQVSVLHNIVHLLFGVAGIAMSRTAPTARSFLVGGGLIYLALWLYGLLIDLADDANFVPVNEPDNWLHFGLGLAMLLLGLLLARPRRAR
ncbi:DUF4383 domain-containing protein [Streptomyces sp. NPDC127092]|uniref:DUF4383 domain-containing protein n=1 Tax=Streptomyces sp. NPDC127092 TaxID=3347135 RepID=UPI0036516D4F